MPEQQHGFAATARLSMSRAEQSFLGTRAAVEAGTVSWAETAARGGYADRTGAAAMDDESYWLYRIWA